MRNFFTFYRKELRGFFLSPFGWIILALVAGMQGWSLSMAMKGLQGAPITESLVYYVFHAPNFWFYFLFIFPLITMRLFAEEERNGTLEALLTAPVHTWQLVLGKYFATLTFYAILWVPAFVNFKLFSVLTDLPAPFNSGSLYGAFLIIFLIGALLIAIGCLASALTSSQIIAGVVTIGLVVIHFLLGFVTVFYGDAYQGANLFHYISMQEHLASFTKGLIDSRPIVYYLTATVFVLFLTHHAINWRRWRT